MASSLSRLSLRLETTGHDSRGRSSAVLVRSTAQADSGRPVREEKARAGRTSEEPSSSPPGASPAKIFRSKKTGNLMDLALASEAASQKPRPWKNSKSSSSAWSRSSAATNRTTASGSAPSALGGAESGGESEAEAALPRERETTARPQGHTPAWLPPPPPVSRPRATHNAGMLAYIGDSVYEMYARWHFLNPPVAIPGYVERVMSVVCCEAQDLLLRRLEKAGALTGEEEDVLRWGRNANTGARRAKGRAGSSTYANATALETLIGYLYLTDTERLHQVMLELGFTCRSSDTIVSPGLFKRGRTAQ